jgi:hypothetical protein
VGWAKKRWKPSRFFRRISGIEKGLVCHPTKPLSFGGANRDRTGDLYNAIANRGTPLPFPLLYPNAEMIDKAVFSGRNSLPSVFRNSLRSTMVSPQVLPQCFHKTGRSAFCNLFTIRPDSGARLGWRVLPVYFHRAVKKGGRP